jgi:hypothetical protein
VITVADKRVLSVEAMTRELNTDSYVDILEVDVLIPERKLRVRIGCRAREDEETYASARGLED